MSTPFDHRSIPESFLASPLAALLSPLHHALLRLRGPPRLLPPNTRAIRVVCISDTHTESTDVPDGDLLIHAGDLSNAGSLREIQATVNWLQRLPHRHKVVICGNHDSYFDARSRRDEDRDKSESYASISASAASIRSFTVDDDANGIDWADIHYLQHESITLSFPTASPAAEPKSAHTSAARPQNDPTNTRSLTVYGAPQIPALVPFGPEHAFTYPPHHDAWTATIPPGTDILVTHTPPAAHCDLSPVFSAGCPFLLAEVWRVRPALHVFGHVHPAYGREPVFWDEQQRAWERLCAARRNRAAAFYCSRAHGRAWLWALVRGGIAGLAGDLVDVKGWVDAVRVVVYGVLGVLWARVWKGENSGGGWMVNAACMYRDSRRLGNQPLVVEL